MVAIFVAAGLGNLAAAFAQLALILAAVPCAAELAPALAELAGDAVVAAVIVAVGIAVSIAVAVTIALGGHRGRGQRGGDGEGGEKKLTHGISPWYSALAGGCGRQRLASTPRSLNWP